MLITQHCSVTEGGHALLIKHNFLRNILKANTGIQSYLKEISKGLYKTIVIISDALVPLHIQCDI